MTRRAHLSTLLAAALAVVLALLVAPPPAQAAPPVYVALGDSYASGTGTRSYLADGTSCQRSTYAYPVTDRRGARLRAELPRLLRRRIADVTNTQLSALTTATNYVSISVGGNDAGFSDVLTKCALPWWASNCDGAINGAQNYINATMPGQLATLYAAIRTRAPSAVVVVVGYPRIFNGEDCNALTWFSPAEEARLNATADLINAKTAATAAAAGFQFANPTTPFVGMRSATAPSGSTGCPRRSRRATTPTGRDTRPATRRRSVRCSPVRSWRSPAPWCRPRGRPATSRPRCRARTPAATPGSRPSPSGCRTCARPSSGRPPSGTASTSTAG